jgi:prolyl oligopeptidase
MNPLEHITYPNTRQALVTDTFYGIAVNDPFRWLEDDLSDETHEWIKAQNLITQNYLLQLPQRDHIRKLVEKNWNYERISAPFVEGDYTYFYKNDGLQNQSVLYRKKEDGEAEVFLDPNSFSPDGTTSLAGISFSPDGSLLAFQLSEGGSDWRTVVVWDAKTKQTLPLEEPIKDVKFSGISWNGNEGFYYSSYDKVEGKSELSGKTTQHKLFYHRLGNAQHQDELVFGGTPEQHRRYVSGSVTECGRYLIISAAQSTTGNELYMCVLDSKMKHIHPVIQNFDHSHSVVHSDAEFLYIVTNLNAPNRRLVKMSVKDKRFVQAREVISETSMPLSVSIGGGRFFAQYLKDAHTHVISYDVNGLNPIEVPLPGKGTAGGFSGKWADTQVYYSFTNYIVPPSIYRYNTISGTSSLYNSPKTAFETENYETYQVFYVSTDGTKVPMTISHKKGIQKDGRLPTMLYGYGGFNISLTPSFSPAIAAWLELGGVYAVANIRGGGEYGKIWHDGGRQMNKQQVFDDFISAGQFLIQENYCSSKTLGISGGSNGGLLVGACMLQVPELFAVAIPSVGVLDMLRYHTFTAGAGWAYDYGTVDDSEDMFNYLLGYSPVHNVQPNVVYPATLIATADHDDRVVPAHSYKFAAALQAHNPGKNPSLIRIDTKAGHGAGKPTAMLIDEVADKHAFALYHMTKP